MAGYLDEKKKTSVRFFWRLCLQTAGAIGVFFMVLSLFQTSAPQVDWLQQTVRECFTSDADITPVIEWFENTNTDTELESGVVQVTAPGH